MKGEKMGKQRLQMQRREKPFIEPKPPKAAPENITTRRINQYTCSSCGGVITTIDRNEGVTPWMLTCRATEGCGGTMRSHGYTVDTSLKPDHEWYTPAKLPKGEMREYVQMGGLLIRRIES